MRTPLLFRLVPAGLLLALFVLAGCSDLGKPILLRPAPELSADTLDFGVVSPGNGETRTLVIGNHGDAVLRGSASLQDAPSIACDRFAILSGGGAFEVAPGGTHTIVVRFLPLNPGPVACTLRLGGGLPGVTLRGAGAQPVATPGCSISTGLLDFGSVTTGQTASRTLRVHSTGTASLALQAQSSCPAFTVILGDGPHTLAPGDSLEVTVNFNPSLSGPVECTLSFGPDCPTVVLRGEALAPAVCAVSTTSLEFSNVSVGSRASLTLRVRNNGGSPLTLNPVTSCAAFVLPGGAGPFSVAAHDSLVVAVEFAPTAGGRQNCTLTLAADCPSVALGGTGLSVSFARDVAPTLSRYNCSGCHAYATPGDLVNVASGSPSGSVLIQPFAPTSSVLYARIANLRTLGSTMPPGSTGMSTADRAKWFNWIMEGALDN